METEKTLRLAPRREASVLRRHPWIFSGAVQSVTGDPASGETVAVRGSSGEFLAWASYSPHSQIRARIWTFDPEEKVDAAFFRRRIQKAYEYRLGLGFRLGDAFRLLHGEADGLPGVVVDQYGPYLSCQFLSAGAEAWRRALVDALAALPGVRGVYERSEAEARLREGLPLADGLLRGEEPPPDFTIREKGVVYRMDMPGGHKTGFYLDQRDNRLAVDSLASGASVLDCCCYSGAFGIRSALAGAREVTFLDDAPAALALAQENCRLNGLEGDARLAFQRGDMFTQLRKYRDSRRSFDLIVLDPPKFASTQGRLQRAARGYKDVNLLGCKLLNPGGTLLTFSCSAAMTPEFFQTVVAEALTDSGRSARVVRTFTQAPDHPMALNFPEGRYLTGLELRMD
ncbi:MAG: class I SAM-dependent rRNA methyltransferase [Oligosphaeraceae bacterium]